MNIVIRKAETKDVEAMHKLVIELATYEKDPEAVITTPSTILRDGFGKEKIFDALIAEADGQIVGMAVYYTAYSTWKGKVIYLDDFVISENFRQYGIGKILFDEVGKIALSEQASQLRWHVLDWNTPAINFYKKYDASLDNHWITCKIEKEELRKLFGKS